MTNDWREKFNETFRGYLIMTDGTKELYRPREEIISFIAQTRTDAKREVLQSVLDEYDEIKEFVTVKDIIEIIKSKMV